MGDQHVRRLDVAVKGQFGMGMCGSSANLPQQFNPFAQVTVMTADIGHQIIALDPLCHHEGPPIRGDAAIDDARDIGMFQPGQNLALALKPVPGHAVRRTDKFQGSGLLKQPIIALDQIDLAHPACTELSPDLPAAEQVARFQRVWLIGGNRGGIGARMQETCLTFRRTQQAQNRSRNLVICGLSPHKGFALLGRKSQRFVK